MKKPKFLFSQYDKERQLTTEAYSGHCVACQRNDVLLVIQITDGFKENSSLRVDPSYCYDCIKSLDRKRIMDDLKARMLG